MTDVDLEKVQFSEYIHVGKIADLDKDEEDKRDEEEKGGENGETLAVLGGGLEVTSCYRVHRCARESRGGGRDLGDRRRIRVRIRARR